MHIAEILQRDKPSFSFEFFPPKTGEAWESLFERIADFHALRPSFVSVTYGAGGSTREKTHDLVVRLKAQYPALDPVPHLTCVQHSEADIERILERYAQAGVSNIMALRGDKPRDDPGYDHARDVMPNAIHLVRFIRQFNERAAGDLKGGGFGIGVAGFPEGHPDTPNRLRHMEHLQAKVDAGADYVCTQMFFDNDQFYDWCERCRIAGVRVPLVAGIMPITSITGMKRMADLAAGTNFPAALQRAIYRVQDDPEAVQRVGVHWATEQCRDLIDHHVAGIHLYTLNRSDATQEIYRSLGVKDSTGLRVEA